MLRNIYQHKSWVFKLPQTSTLNLQNNSHWILNLDFLAFTKLELIKCSNLFPSFLFQVISSMMRENFNIDGWWLLKLLQLIDLKFSYIDIWACCWAKEIARFSQMSLLPPSWMNSTKNQYVTIWPAFAEPIWSTNMITISIFWQFIRFEMIAKLYTIFW